MATKKVAVKRAKRQITVHMGELVKPLVAYKCDVGTTISKFLEDNSLSYSTKVRINAEPTKASYKLKKGDIITTIGSVSGGF